MTGADRIAAYWKADRVARSAPRRKRRLLLIPITLLSRLRANARPSSAARPANSAGRDPT